MSPEVLSDTQEQILEAAMQCIVRDGIDGASMRNVAKEADVSVGLLSYHFDDKRSLIESTFQLATDRLLETSMDSIKEVDSAAEQVIAFIRGAFHEPFLSADYLALRTTLWAIARTDDQIRLVEQELYRRYTEHLRDLIRSARPDLTEVEACDRTTDVIVTQNGLWLDWARHRDQRALERGLSRCEQIALG